MDRREFFRRAGAGAGALIAAPQLELYRQLFPEEEKSQEEIKIEYEAGYIYCEQEQIMAISNIRFDMHCEAIETTSMDAEYRTYIAGKVHANFYGDALNLSDDTYDYFQEGEILHIVMTHPDHGFILEADGYITELGIGYAISEDEPTHTFKFTAEGPVDMHDANPQEG